MATTNIQYHKFYEDIQPEEVKIQVRKAIKKGLFKKDKSTEEKQQIIRELHKELCSLFKLEENTILFDDSIEGYGSFSWLDKAIRLKNTSLVTYLHEFQHYKAFCHNEDNTEDKARGFSISLFYQATPILCRNAIEKGLIIHQTEFKE